MTLADSFLADIISDPEDDTPRLVYADWLEDQGDATSRHRGAFIRLQVEAARLPALDREREAFLDRAEELRQRHGQQWDVGLRQLVLDSRYQRGFIEHISLTVAQFVDLGKLLLHLAPIRRVRLEHGGEKPVSAIVDSPFLSRLIGLELTYWQLDAADITRFLESPRLAGLRSLSLRCNNLGDLGVRQLAASPHLAGLTSLDLGHNDLQYDAAKALAESPHLTRLKHLDLHFNELNRAGMLTLAGSPIFAPVVDLDIGFNEITDEGAAALADSRMTAPHRLVLSHSELTDPGLEAIVSSQRMVRELNTLELQFNAIEDEGAARLAATPGLANLVTLNLSKNRIGPTGVHALAHSPHLANLRYLDLESNPIGDAGARALARSPYLKNIVRLTLGSLSMSYSSRTALEERFEKRIRWYG